MKYLIIGASGFIGSALYHCCKKRQIEVYGSCLRHPENPEYHIFDQTENPLEKLLSECGITDFQDLAVALCAANASIDACKRDEAASQLLNVTSARRMIDDIARIGAKPIFLSSEAVFDGKRGLYREDDPVSPLCLYGRQKAEVEEYIKHISGEYLVFRISRAVSVFSGRGDIFDEFHKTITKGRQIVCLRGQCFNPTDVEDVAESILLACEAGLHGLYHIANRDYVTRRELAKRYARRVLKQEASIVERGANEMGFLDYRHIRGGLNAAKLEHDLKYQFKTLDEILRERTQNEHRRN